MRVFIFCLLSVCTTLLAQGQNIGIGLNNPSYPLTVQANPGNSSGITQKNATVELGFYTSSASAYLQTWSPHDLNFATNNGVARLTLAHSTGFLGVNTMIPTAQLDVNGTFRLRGNGAALGRVLVSDASGGATWQTISAAGAWSLSGNAGTVPATNFLGTTDNQPLMLRQNNVYAGQLNYALRNYFIGNQSGLNTTGKFNIAMGDSTLLENISGNSNIAIGPGALQQSPNYSNLIAIGDSALFKNGTVNDGGSINYCTRNTAVGSKALFSNSQGYQNTAFGFEAGYGMGLGWSNTAIGAFAMRNGGSFGAEGNVGVGVNALYNTKNLHNTGVGASALYTNTTGSRNTAIGHSALYANLDGEHNTAIGFSALATSSSGDFNTAIGAYANTISSAISNATAIGTRAHVTQSNSVVLGAIAGVNGAGTSANIGIGTTAPSHAMDLQANSLFAGRVQLRLHETENDFARLRFTNTITTSNWEVASLPATTNAAARMNFFYSAFGDVLSLKGNGDATLAGILTQSSDSRLKKNILLIRSSLSRLLQLNGYQYQWKDESRDQSIQTGVLAQEVENLFPELVKKDENGTLSVNYIGLIPVMINAMKEQQQKIDSLEKRLAALEEMLNR